MIAPFVASAASPLVLVILRTLIPLAGEILSAACNVLLAAAVGSIMPLTVMLEAVIVSGAVVSVLGEI
jgi:hypothetical protein